MNNTEILDSRFLLNNYEQIQASGPDKRTGSVGTAILLSLVIHLLAGGLFLFMAGETPNRITARPMEVAIVTPEPRKTVMTLPSPAMPKPARPRSRPAPVPLPVPVAPPKPVPVIERTTQPREIIKTAEKTVQSPQPLPAVPSQATPLAGSQPQGKSLSQHAQGTADVSGAAGPHGGDEALPVVGPSYDAAYLSNPVPQYPSAARRLRLQGTATLRVLVGRDGHPKTVRLEKTSGARILDDAAINAVQHWLFVPARRGDRTIAAEVDVPIRFRMN